MLLKKNGQPDRRSITSAKNVRNAHAAVSKKFKEWRENWPEPFWERVAKAGPNECWNWIGAIGGPGYGEFTFDRQVKTAHREAYILEIGEIPKGMLVCHKCDNRKCCNPAHLFLGTMRDNMHDCIKKGRFKFPKVLHGEQNPTSKLTQTQVDQMRTLRATGTPTIELAKQFGIDQAHVRRIIRRVCWK